MMTRGIIGGCAGVHVCVRCKRLQN